MVLLSIDSLKCPEWDLSEDFLSEGVETQKPMEISSLSKNMEEYRANKIIMSTTRSQKKTLKQDISDMLRVIANRKKYFKDNKIKANSCDLSKNIISHEYFDKTNRCEEINYITMKDLPCVSSI